jgi:hypothetical protein
MEMSLARDFGRGKREDVLGVRGCPGVRLTGCVDYVQRRTVRARDGRKKTRHPERRGVRQPAVVSLGVGLDGVLFVGGGVLDQVMAGQMFRELLDAGEGGGKRIRRLDPGAVLLSENFVDIELRLPRGGL